ncbi:MAG: PBP1A family penicillin-binding protein [Myxococcales bacterium]|nr:PBP1A family penicillin-binding protein [Myxococcales bacterium]USN50465.1 MAG: PBP1A family penicillin-binding protein [Myxococcales bacterium]
MSAKRQMGNRSKSNRYWFFIKILVVLSALFFVVTAAGLYWVASKDLPQLDALKDYQPPQSTLVYDRYHRLIGRFYDERRTVISIHNLPSYVIQAFVAAEDGSFFEHDGLDYLGLLRAVVLEIKHRTVGGRRVGGSTITQQTARTMLLSSSQTYIRKIKEIILARRIEQALTKDQILHLYLNQIYFGNGAYGVEEASLTYFSKPASQLELFEAAALAAIPKSPNRINPFGDLVRLKERQNYVLEQMVKGNFISEEQAQEAKQTFLFNASHEKQEEVLAPYFLTSLRSDLVHHFDEEIIKKGGLKIFSTLDSDLQRHAERTLKEGLRSIDQRQGYRGPLLRPDKKQNQSLIKELSAFKKKAFAKAAPQKVWDLRRLARAQANSDITSLVRNSRIVNLQEGLVIGARVEKINEAKNTALIDVGTRFVELPFNGIAWAWRQKTENSKKLSQIIQAGDIILVKLNNPNGKVWASLEQAPLINGGIVALDVETGGILAMVGGYDFTRSAFNRITQAKRQPGSGMKPLIYSLAIDREVVTAASIITDSPRAFFDPGTEEFWRPRNHTRRYLGDISVRRCLRSSVNTCTITLLEKIGIDNFLSFAKEVNLISPLTPFPRNLTIALGSAEVIPMDLANAMRIFPREGKYSPYHSFSKVVFADGQEQENNLREERQLIRPESAFITTNILQGVISGINRSRYLGKVQSEMAGKTGTTNDVRSAWFFGYSPKVLALVYVGRDDNSGLGDKEWGVTTAFPIWARFMNEVPENQEPLAFIQPPNVDWYPIDPESEKQQTFVEGDPQAVAQEVPKELFIDGTAPKIPLENSDAIRIKALENSAFAP